MAVYNPFAGNAGRLGGIYTRRKGDEWNPYGAVAEAQSRDPLTAGALGYGAETDSPERQDYAWQRFNATIAPRLTDLQRQYILRNRSLFDQALADARAVNPGARYSDVLGNVDVLRFVQSATPRELGLFNPYTGTRWR